MDMPTLPAGIDVQALARHLAVLLDPEALLDAKDVAGMLKLSPRYVTEELATTKSFPEAIRLPGPDGRRGKPRWSRKDIVTYIDAQRRVYAPARRVGAPRKRSEFD